MNHTKIQVFFMLLFIALPGVHAQYFTPCQDSVLLRIGLISDPQYCDCDPAGIRIYRGVLQKLPSAIDSLNKYQVDFVMNLGDMIDRYYESFDSVSRIYESLTMPYFNLLGNHDFEEIPVALQPSILSRYGMPDYYYNVIFKNWRFLILDGTELAAYSRAGAIIPSCTPAALRPGNPTAPIESSPATAHGGLVEGSRSTSATRVLGPLGCTSRTASSTWSRRTTTSHRQPARPAPSSRLRR